MWRSCPVRSCPSRGSGRGTEGSPQPPPPPSALQPRTSQHLVARCHHHDQRPLDQRLHGHGCGQTRRTAAPPRSSRSSMSLMAAPCRACGPGCPALAADGSSPCCPNTRESDRSRARSADRRSAGRSPGPAAVPADALPPTRPRHPHRCRESDRPGFRGEATPWSLPQSRRNHDTARLAVTRRTHAPGSSKPDTSSHLRSTATNASWARSSALVRLPERAYASPTTDRNSRA